MPLMGSLYVGVSGLQTSQNALNTTAHNLSNIDTTGYTRQQVLQSTRRYNVISYNKDSVSNQETGLGVLFAKVRQVRDSFVDQTYRKESGRSAFYEVSATAMEEVEGVLGELQGEAFQEALEDLWTSIQELSKDPSSSITQGVFVQSASEFIERAVSVYDQLEAYQDNLNTQVKQMTDKINEYGNKIVELNEQIRFIQVGGVESPNDLKDVRNHLIDELAKMADISYHEELDGTVSIQIEGVDFVKRDRCYNIDLKIDGSTGFYTPFWPQNASYRILDDGTKEYNIDGAEVFDLEREISSDLDTDIGSLKATLLARGDHRADYRDIDEANYDNDVSQSIVMNIQGEFDQLVHNVVTKINKIIESAGAVYNADGTLAKQGYMRNSDGTPMQLFEKVTTPGYELVDGKWEFCKEDWSKPDSLYTLKNLRINEELLQSPSKLKFMKEDNSVDYDSAEALKAAFTEESYYLNPNVKKKTTFIDYYTDMVAQVANSGYVYRSIAANQEATVNNTYSAREQVVGVSSDEELSNMIKFQNAYNASSRYINVISEMLEHILNTLGM